LGDFLRKPQLLPQILRFRPFFRENRNFCLDFCAFARFSAETATFASDSAVLSIFLRKPQLLPQVLRFPKEPSGITKNSYLSAPNQPNFDYGTVSLRELQVPRSLQQESQILPRPDLALAHQLLPRLQGLFHPPGRRDPGRTEEEV
jgi:hypothetical protein